MACPVVARASQSGMRPGVTLRPELATLPTFAPQLAVRRRCIVRWFPSEQAEHHEEAHDVRNWDEPALLQPALERATLAIDVRQSDARGRSEPRHRAAEADGEGEQRPVVAA